MVFGNGVWVVATKVSIAHQPKPCNILHIHSTPPCDDACEAQDLELLKANIAEHGPASVCVNAATWNDYVEVSAWVMCGACRGLL